MEILIGCYLKGTMQILKNKDEPRKNVSVLFCRVSPEKFDALRF